MIDLIFEGFLVFTRIYVIVPIVIFGYYSKKSAAFEKALYILLFTIVLSPYLKSLWQIPLNPALGKEGYAFPSGHMQMAVSFWGLLAIELRQKWLYIAIAALLAGIGSALIYFGYHDLKDVLGGVFFSIITILFFLAIEKKLALGKTALIGLIALLLGTILVGVIPNPSTSPFLALGGFYGFTLGSYLNRNKEYHSCLIFCFRSLFAFLGIGIVYGFFTFLPYIISLNSVAYYSKLKTLIQFFCIGLWIAWGASALPLKLFKCNSDKGVRS